MTNSSDSIKKIQHSSVKDEIDDLKKTFLKRIKNCYRFLALTFLIYQRSIEGNQLTKKKTILYGFDTYGG